MIITERFFFTHMPKAGGTFITKALVDLHQKMGMKLRDTNEENFDSKHYLQGAVPEKHWGKPVLLNVRNPFSHLVSIYKFKWWHEQPDAFFDVKKCSRKFPSFPHLSFTEFVLASNDWDLVATADWMVELKPLLIKYDIGTLSMWYLPAMMHDTTRTIMEFERFMRVDNTEYREKRVNIIHCENLNEELYDFLLKLDYKAQDIAFIKDRGVEQPAREERILSQGVYSHSIAQHNAKQSFKDYYSPELVKFVLFKERAVFKLLPEYQATFDDVWFEQQCCALNEQVA